MVARLAEMSRGNLEENRSRMAKASGFSLQAGVAAEADKRNKQGLTTMAGLNCRGMGVMSTRTAMAQPADGGDG